MLTPTEPGGGPASDPTTTALFAPPHEINIMAKDPEHITPWTRLDDK
jgi:hypothetical protein